MSRRRSPVVEVPVAVLDPVLAAGSPEALRVAALAEVEVTDASSAEEQLGRRVEAELDRCAGMLFTATPRTDLLEVARWQRLADQAWAGQVRHVVAATTRMSGPERRRCSGTSPAAPTAPAPAYDASWKPAIAAAFPGCSRPASRTDKDHLIPWPHGSTSPDNMHCLCRHHQKAKQSSSFTVIRLTDGSTIWITRGQWWFRRQPPGY